MSNDFDPSHSDTTSSNGYLQSMSSQNYFALCFLLNALDSSHWESGFHGRHPLRFLLEASHLLKVTKLLRKSHRASNTEYAWNVDGWMNTYNVNLFNTNMQWRHGATVAFMSLSRTIVSAHSQSALPVTCWIVGLSDSCAIPQWTFWWFVSGIRLCDIEVLY